MRLLLNTNIVVDVISKRKGYENSLQLIRYCELGKVEGFISATTVTDIMYILRKHITPREVRNAVQTLLLILDVVDVLKSDITSAFLSDIKDFEDAVQSCCAQRIKVDYIATNNLKDFKNSTVPAISPEKALELVAY